jgi:WD40 repeat protein
MNPSPSSSLATFGIAKTSALKAIPCGHFIHLVEKLPDVAAVVVRKPLLLELTTYVYSVIFSPDGATIASAIDDGTVILWDAVSGQKKQTLARHSRRVTSAAFSPDGAAIASASDDNNIIVWDVTSGQRKQTLTGHTGCVYSVAFSPDGATIASGSKDSTVMLWDVASGVKKQTLTGHTSCVYFAAFSPDGATIASASEDKTVLLWDVITAQKKHTLVGHTDHVYCVVFSPDGSTIASGSKDKTVILWDATSKQKKHTLLDHADYTWFVTFSPDGATLASLSSDKNIIVWDAATGQKKQTLAGHANRVSSVAFSPDGATIASGSHDKTVMLWDTSSIRPITKFGPLQYPVDRVKLEGFFLNVTFREGSNHRLVVPNLHLAPNALAEKYRHRWPTAEQRSLPKCERHFMRPVEAWCSQCREFCCANCTLMDSHSQDAVHRSHRLIDLADPNEAGRKLRLVQRELLAQIGNDAETLLEESLIIGQAMHAFLEEELLLAHDRYAAALLSLSTATMELHKSSAAMLPTELIRTMLEQ